MNKQTDRNLKYHDHLLAVEKEILDEEGVYTTPDIFEDAHRENEKCMYCGYDIVLDNDGLRVLVTGDVIHKDCWRDYAEDNKYDLCTVFSDV